MSAAASEDASNETQADSGTMRTGTLLSGRVVPGRLGVAAKRSNHSRSFAASCDQMVGWSGGEMKNDLAGGAALAASCRRAARRSPAHRTARSCPSGPTAPSCRGWSARCEDAPPWCEGPGDPEGAVLAIVAAQMSQAMLPCHMGNARADPGMDKGVCVALSKKSSDMSKYCVRPSSLTSTSDECVCRRMFWLRS